MTGCLWLYMQEGDFFLCGRNGALSYYNLWIYLKRLILIKTHSLCIVCFRVLIWERLQILRTFPQSFAFIFITNLN